MCKHPLDNLYEDYSFSVLLLVTRKAKGGGWASWISVTYLTHLLGEFCASLVLAVPGIAWGISATLFGLGHRVILSGTTLERLVEVPQMYHVLSVTYHIPHCHQNLILTPKTGPRADTEIRLNVALSCLALPPPSPGLVSWALDEFPSEACTGISGRTQVSRNVCPFLSVLMDWILTSDCSVTSVRGQFTEVWSVPLSDF